MVWECPVSLALRARLAPHHSSASAATWRRTSPGKVLCRRMQRRQLDLPARRPRYPGPSRRAGSGGRWPRPGGASRFLQAYPDGKAEPVRPLVGSSKSLDDRQGNGDAARGGHDPPLFNRSLRRARPACHRESARAAECQLLAPVKSRYLGDKRVGAPGQHDRLGDVAGGGVLPAGASLRVGERAEFLRAVVADGVDADDLAVLGQLH